MVKIGQCAPCANSAPCAPHLLHVLCTRSMYFLLDTCTQVGMATEALKFKISLHLAGVATAGANISPAFLLRDNSLIAFSCHSLFQLAPSYAP